MPATATLRANFSDARVTLVVSNECADLLPAISGVDRVLIARRNLSDATLFLAVARERFDCCIDFTRNDRSAFLAFLSGARKRVVSYRVRDQSKTRARIYNEFVDNRMRDMHTIDYNLALLEPLGIRNVSRALHLDLPDIQPAGQKSLIMLVEITISILFLRVERRRWNRYTSPRLKQRQGINSSIFLEKQICSR